MQSKHEQTRSKWRHHVAAVTSSSQSAAAYCRSHNLNLTSFYIWRRKLQGRGTIPIVLAENPFSGLQVIREAPSNLPDAKWLAEFVRHLCQGDGQ